jgi:hypothetical protein
MSTWPELNTKVGGRSASHCTSFLFVNLNAISDMRLTTVDNVSAVHLVSDLVGNEREIN